MSNDPDDELSSTRNMIASMHWSCHDAASERTWRSFAWRYVG